MSTAGVPAGTAGEAGRAARKARPWWLALLLSEYLVLLLTVLYVLIVAPIVPEILTFDTWRDILAAMMPLLVVAIGQTFVLIVAGIDLSAALRPRHGERGRGRGHHDGRRAARPRPARCIAVPAGILVLSCRRRADRRLQRCVRHARSGCRPSS